MKFYEEEVLSLPAGSSIEFVEKYRIYSCPVSHRNANLKKSLFMTFRNKNGGEMSTLYKLDETVILNPSDSNEIDRLGETNLKPEYIKRLKDYLTATREKWQDTDDCKYYVFSEDTIELSKKPRPKNGNQVNIAYYTLKELLQNELV
jgi:hypothetical protein